MRLETSTFTVQYTYFILEVLNQILLYQIPLLLAWNRWINHGQPPGANVAEIADAAILRAEVIFTIR